MQLLQTKKQSRIILLLLLLAAITGGLIVFGINGYVVLSSKQQILTPENAAALSDVDCILVLGCGVRPDGQPSAMLADRLQRSVELYKAGVSQKLLMSGDHGQVNYDEVNVMKQYALKNNIPSQDIFMDHAGFSTYESMYRAKAIFQAKKVVIITQQYHLYRALYIANTLGLEAYGVAADYRNYAGQFYRDAREILARDKDFFQCILKTKPTYLGETIPVWGNGNSTNG